jgi:hypothetical protein
LKEEVFCCLAAPAAPLVLLEQAILLDINYLEFLAQV